MLELESRIDRVTVFRRGARVTRVASLPAVHETTRVRFARLPLSLDDGAIEVRVEGPRDERSSPVAVEAKVGLELAARHADEPSSDPEEVRAARRDEALAKAALTQLENELARLGWMALVSRPEPKEGEAPIASPTTARLAMLELRSRETARLEREIEDAKERLRGASEKRASLAERLRTSSSARQAEEGELRKVVLVTLVPGAVASSESSRLVLSYLVPGARWAPSYRLALDVAQREGEATLRAMVRQRTGEDWSNVALTVSTAAPERFTDLPDLKAIRIGRAVREPKRVGYRPAPDRTDELFADYDASFARKPRVHAAAPELEYDTAKSFQSMPVVLDELEGGPPTRRQAPAAFGAAPPPPGAYGGAPPPQAPPPSAARSSAAPPAKPLQRTSTFAPQEAVKRRGNVRPEMAYTASEQLLSPLEEETELAPDGALRNYGGLRIAPPSHPQRGRLVVSTRLEMYAEVSLTIDEGALVAIDRETNAARASEEAPAPARHSFPDAGIFDHAYDADGRSSVLADGAFHAVAITSKPVRTTPRFVVVPRESQDAFRVVELASPFDVALLPGPLDVYVAGDYRLTTDLPVTPAKGRVVLGLGVEPALKIARNARFEEESAGLMRGSLDLRHDVRIAITSHLGTPAEIEVRERVPVTQKDDEETKVTIERVEPSWKPWAPEGAELRGGHAWVVQLDAHGKRELSLTYVVRISAKNELVGGNRREKAQ